MTKAERAALATMSPEQLVEGFVREAKLYELSDVSKANAALENELAYAAEIERRGGMPSLAPLLDSSDPFIAYSVARLLARLENFQKRALGVLDSIVESHVGFASDLADTARNMVRYGNPDGDPIEVENRRAAIRARYNRA